MAFSQLTVLQGWVRSGRRCECRGSAHGHSGRCVRMLGWNLRGSDLLGGWETHHVTAGGPHTASNCEILCQPCHKKTGTYGG
jgi:5-methylcytosine-specific restriction endonuclease McrA